MANVVTTTPLGRKLEFDITQATEVAETPDLNVRSGPTTLYGLSVDNTKSAAVINWVKIFDSNGAGLAAAIAAGTARAQIGIPVEAVGTDPALGKVFMMTPNGLAFVNGLSWHASTTGGNGAPTVPATAVRVQAITQETS